MSSNPPDVCIVEDDAAQRSLIRRYIARAELTCVEAANGKEAFEIIQAEKPKVIISDWQMPLVDGLELLELVRENAVCANTYFIMITAQHDREANTQAFQKGVDDFLAKPVDRWELLARVRVGMRLWEFQQRLRQAAVTDGLTGLFNHDHINTLLEVELNRARRLGMPLAVIMLDLDFFKAVNDTHGHLAGNEVLIGVARALKATVRNIDTIARFGGEEFIVLAPGAGLEEGRNLAERIRLAISQTVVLSRSSGHCVTASAGVASSDDARVQVSADLVDLADRALYLAKNRGRDQVATANDVADDSDGLLLVVSKEVEALRKRVVVLSARTKEAHVQSIASLLQVLDEKDRFSARHSINVACYVELLAEQLECTDALKVSTRNAALLHDIGKVGVPDRVLKKPSTLTADEHALMLQVPLASTRIVDHLNILQAEVQIIRHQREFYDGSGFPSGLVGDQIPLGSRILLIADAFDCMTTERRYRSGMPIDSAAQELVKCAGTQFDPALVQTMCSVIESQRSVIQQQINETGAAIWRSSMAKLTV